MPVDTIEELAVLAHRLWCERMGDLGWSAGQRYDRDARTHDALVPFGALGRHDQRTARLCIQASGLAERIAKTVEYPRGPDRPLVIEEMRAGLRVVLCRDGAPASLAEVGPGDVGAVESWTVDDQGELELIRVRWPGGACEEYAASERALARAEELA